jgi:hypothetical protein
MRGYRNTIETNQITDDLLHKIQITSDEEKVFLVVEYKPGKSFTIEKHFNNNYIGLALLEQEIERFNTEDKVIKYFGLGEKK